MNNKLWLIIHINIFQFHHFQLISWKFAAHCLQHLFLLDLEANYNESNKTVL